MAYKKGWTRLKLIQYLRRLKKRGESGPPEFPEQWFTDIPAGSQISQFTPLTDDSLTLQGSGTYLDGVVSILAGGNFRSYTKDASATTFPPGTGIQLQISAKRISGPIGEGVIQIRRNGTTLMTTFLLDIDTGLYTYAGTSADHEPDEQESYIAPDGTLHWLGYWSPESISSGRNPSFYIHWVKPTGLSLTVSADTSFELQFDYFAVDHATGEFIPVTRAAQSPIDTDAAGTP